MARTESTMQPLGTIAPDFSLPDVVSGKAVSRDGAKGAGGLLVMFLCVHCPFVKFVEQGIARFAGDYAGQGLGIVGISSNDAAAFPDDSPEGMRAQAKRLGFTFPYLYDESQQVARAYEAACTPGLLPLRSRSEAGVSRAIRCEPSQPACAGDGQRFASRGGGAAGGQAATRTATAEPRLQHQVEINS